MRIGVLTGVIRCLERDDAAIVVVAEGAVPEGGAELLSAAEVDAFGHKRLGGVGIWLADEIARRTSAESRAVVLGHIQRGGTPTAYDRCWLPGSVCMQSMRCTRVTPA